MKTSVASTRIWLSDSKRYEYEHRAVWENERGRIPRGYYVVHIDGNLANNDIGNLKLVSVAKYRKLKAGYVVENGVWYKRCRGCGGVKELSEFYKYPYREEYKSLCFNCDRARSHKKAH